MEIAERWDLVVAGAGPAGTSGAITAARAGLRVLLLEQGRYPRHKVCGEFVSAECLQLLEQLLDGESKALLRNAPRVSHARFYLGRTCASFQIPPCASIPRYDLDHALWETAKRAGAICLDNVRVDAIEADFLVRSTMGDVRATSAIAAAGRWSKLRQPQPSDATKWLGIKAHFSEFNPPLSTDLYFSPAGYCGVQPLSHDTVNVCAMVRAEHASRFDKVFELHPELKRRSRDWESQMAPIVTSPLIFAEPMPELDGVLFAGDAAGFIDPFAGDGISLAIRTGAAAANCVVQCGKDATRVYRDIYRRQFLPAFRTASCARRLLTAPTPVAEVMMQLMNIRFVARWWFAGTRGRSERLSSAAG